MSKITRRQLLALGGTAALGAVAGGTGVGLLMSDQGQRMAAQSPTPPRATFDSWRHSRQAPYYIGHRGAGDVVPEHTLPGYQQALDWRTACLEISVVMSSDGVLYCLHDLTLDRTTTEHGQVDHKTAKELDRVRVSVPRLGPRWVGPNMPAMPRLADVLAAVGGRAVLCIEPKNDSAYDPLISMIEKAGLKDTVMIKLDASSPRIPLAKKAGYPVFAYLGNEQVATASAIEELGRRLDPYRDALVLPAYGSSGWFPDDLIRHAVDTGVPVWVFPVHRRVDVKHFSRLGVEGMIAPAVAYLTGLLPPRKTDDWITGAITPGELTRDPYSDKYAISWGDEGVIGLAFPGRPSFLTLGQFCPIEAESYRLVFDITFDPLPKDTWQHMSVAFGHVDDRYYEHRLGVSDGYHALLRGDGSMAVYAHVQGDTNGQLLSTSRSSTPLKPGLWSRLTLDVTPELIRWSRDDGTSVEAKDGRFRGGYLHVGSSATDGKLLLKNMNLA